MIGSWHAAELTMVMHVAKSQDCGSFGRSGSGHSQKLQPLPPGKAIVARTLLWLTQGVCMLSKAI